MRSAVFAVTPTLVDKPQRFENIFRQLRAFQRRGLFTSAEVASVLHSDLYPFPLSFYRASKEELGSRAETGLRLLVEGKLEYKTLEVLESNSAHPIDVVNALSRHARRNEAGFLVVSQTRARSGLMRKIVGSVADAAIFSAAMPVLVLNPAHELQARDGGVNILFAVDPIAPPSEKIVRQVAETAKSLGALVYVVYAVPSGKIRRIFQSYLSAGAAMPEISGIVNRLRSRGVAARPRVLEENISAAATIDRYAAEKNALLIIAAAPLVRKLGSRVFGSTLLSLLRRTTRPLLVFKSSYRENVFGNDDVGLGRAAAA